MFSYNHPEQIRTLSEISRLYPRPSPYIESNLHKFGVGPSSTMVPVINHMPVSTKKLNLNSSQYFKKADDKKSLCYCCLEGIQADNIDLLTFKNVNNSEDGDGSCINEQAQEKISKITQTMQQQQSNKVNYSQTSLMKYFNKNKMGSMAIQGQTEQKKQNNLKCCDCSKYICQKCARKCNKCHKIVCRFDFKEDNSLGLHNC